MEFVLAGHTLAFFDCREVVGSGPEACSLRVDGIALDDYRFDPSPLEHNGSLLIPLRKRGWTLYGYALAHIDLDSLCLSVLSKVRPYMRLLRIEEDQVVFATATYGSQTGTIKLTKVR